MAIAAKTGEIVFVRLGAVQPRQAGGDRGRMLGGVEVLADGDTGCGLARQFNDRDAGTMLGTLRGNLADAR